MATIITSECINCGACEPECPNTAIYAGGVGWDLNGESHPAIAQDLYYIVASKCTECVGFYDHEACAAVCPVDCCIPDPNNLESHEVLLARARALHPEQTIGDDAPSRFKKGGAGAPAPAVTEKKAEAAPAAVNGGVAAEAKPAAQPVAKAAPAAAPAVAAEKKAEAAPAAASAGVVAEAKPAAQPAPKPAPAAAPAAAAGEKKAEAAAATANAGAAAEPKPAVQPAAKAVPAAAPAAAAPKPAAQPAPKPAPAAAPTAAASNGAAAPAASPADEEYSPTAWQVPVICKDCNEPFTIPYRHFQAGVVFHCLQCSGSFVPNSTMCRTVRDAFEGFYGRRRKDREAFERRRAKELSEFEAKQAAEMGAFQNRLQEIARTMKPAGKLVRPKGIAAMFT